MPVVTLEFSFTQKLPLPARAAFKWATDYVDDDLALIGKRGRRHVQQVAVNALILSDTFIGDDGSETTRQKLVRLYPKELRWTNTHISGPNQHSQFLYELFPTGEEQCLLRFTGSQLRTLPKATPKQIKALAQEVKRDDALIWKNLAKAMAPKTHRRRAR